ncbi:MAG: SH3 domain-containing protein, partial [Thermomicrobiales bacterium]
PEPILTRASSAQGDTHMNFDPGDVVSVADGPLQLRANAGTSAAILRALSIGTRAIVLGGPTSTDGHPWYEIQTIGAAGRGWVAGTYCEKIDL